MELFEAFSRRACVRQLRPVEVPEDDLTKILDAGRRAPSGCNHQPFDFLVVRDPATIAQLASAQSCLGDVSLVIALVADPEKSRWWLEDIAAATENMLLAITALGYASVWIEGTLLREEEKHKRTLGVPEHLRLMIALPIGAALEPVSQPPKRPLEEMTHREKY
ncbi:MAG TPA: nitroreductase family protein [Armatimonadota bacterium]|jgi:nitroreductase